MSEELKAVDKRAAVLRWIEEQEALCAAATPGEWSFSTQRGRPGHCFMSQVWRPDGDSLLVMEATSDEWAATRDAQFIAASRSVLPLALAALRAEVEHHEARRDGLCQGCFDELEFECPTIARIYEALPGAHGQKE